MPPARDSSVIWHDTECGSYSADFPLWEELAKVGSGQVLDLGCGTGRVALHLARRRHTVTGLDIEPALVAAHDERARELPANAAIGDARDFDLGTQFDLVLAPMQLLQLFADSEERLGCLRRVAAHLSPDGVAAFAIVESMPEPVDSASPLPDTREVDGWVYSSLPVDALVDSGSIRVRRLRQTVSPEGELEEELYEVELQRLDAETLEAEARNAGLRPAGRRTIPPTDAHVGSTAVLLRRES
ncbi:MAG TPA: class I SAM-dependent methyltransferase [Solirubrobacterales bacterium]|nr:class I SAM-dependent methyltransferase [Solirubrobacterales bacterium]